MKRREFLQLVTASAASGQTATTDSAAASLASTVSAPSPKTFVSGREDGRFVETAGFLHKYLWSLRPKLEYRPGLTRDEFVGWRSQVAAKLLELMGFPEVPPQPEPRQIWSRQRDGYRLERWEAYPEPWSVVPFLLLVPDGVSQRSRAPAVLCFPGSTGSKEALAGEPAPGATATPGDMKWLDNRMAWHFARRGMIALAVDSPATNETGSDLRERTPLALQAIWMGRSYESVSVFQKACLLQWLARQPYVDAGRIATSGHSLGAKPADILGVLYPNLVSAVIHNDFVCHWQERAVALNLNDPGSHQVVPGIFQWFDYTDLQASLAPRPLLFTEGGRARQVAKIRQAYELWGAGQQVELFHYEKYGDPTSRKLDDVELPVGITPEQYFAYAYVDPSLHRFRPHHAVPWLAKVFRMR